MKEIFLMSCPWCKQKPEIVYWKSIHSRWREVVVECAYENCPAVPHVTASTEKEAIRLWNLCAPKKVKVEG